MARRTYRHHTPCLCDKCEPDTKWGIRLKNRLAILLKEVERVAYLMKKVRGK